MDTYKTLREAVKAAFPHLPEGGRLFDGIDYWSEDDLLTEADARECAEAYTVAKNGNISVPGISNPLYRAVSKADAAWTSQLAVLRHRAGLTQKQLASLIASALGITPGAALTMIGRLECGKSEMANTTLRVALALADALDVDPRELMQK